MQAITTSTISLQHAHIAVLLVCHNRRETTLRCLRALYKNAGEFQLRVVLFDDASTDGTVQAVLSEFPHTIIIEGDGSAYWNGGQFRAWSRALELRPDAFLWLNDDVVLDPDALERLATGWRLMSDAAPNKLFILSAATRDSRGEVTYGGVIVSPSPMSFRMRLAQPGYGLTAVDTFNGNIVLVPREVVDQIGINDPYYFHNLGDYDYGLRASRAGVLVRLMPGTFGICEANKQKYDEGFRAIRLPIREQWQKVNSHHGLPFASWWHFTRRFSGVWSPIHFLVAYRALLGFRR